jgi:triacylglycerol lipase
MTVLCLVSRFSLAFLSHRRNQPPSLIGRRLVVLDANARSKMSKPNDGVMEVMMRELELWVDVGALLIDPVFYGLRVPRGDGKLVVVIPGFMGNDFYLLPMLNWLSRIGYTAVPSSLNISAGCMQRSCDEVRAQIERHSRSGQRSVALIGHSRGGAVAWALATQMPERVSHLVLLGAGFPGLQRSVEDGTRDIGLGELTRMLMRANKLSRRMLDPNCGFPSCQCAFTNYAERPLGQATELISIYGSNDLVIPEGAKMDEGEIVHVPTTHVGLAFHPEVYRILGRFLARKSEPAARQRHQAPPPTAQRPQASSRFQGLGTGSSAALAGEKPDDPHTLTTN